MSKPLVKYKVGFTGTQQGMTDNQKVSFLARLLLLKRHFSALEFHQGQCIGADYDALMLVLSQDGIYDKGIWTVSHPPTDKSKVHLVDCDEVWPEKPYLERNHEIVDTVDLLIVAPRTKEEELRSGTWATYRYAKKLGRPTFILNPQDNED